MQRAHPMRLALGRTSDVWLHRRVTLQTREFLQHPKPRDSTALPQAPRSIPYRPSLLQVATPRTLRCFQLPAIPRPSATALKRGARIRAAVLRRRAWLDLWSESQRPSAALEVARTGSEVQRIQR